MGPPTLNGSLKFIYRITAKICVCSYFLERFARSCSALSTLTNEGPALTISSIILIAGRYACTIEEGIDLPVSAESMKRLIATKFLPPNKYLYNARSLPCVLISGILILGSESLTDPVSKFLSVDSFSRNSMMSELRNFALLACTSLVTVVFLSVLDHLA